MVKGLTAWLDSAHGHLNARNANLVLYGLLGGVLLVTAGFLVRRRLKTGAWGPRADRPARRRWPPP